MDHRPETAASHRPISGAAGRTVARPPGRRARRVAIWGATVALVAGLLSAPSPASATVFPDVPEDHPFAEPIEWAVTTGVTGGYDDGTFRPTVPVSRQALAAFLARYDDGASGSEPEACEGPGPFADVPVSHPFCAEITWLVDLGITTGFDDGTFRPTAPISRQAMAAFLARYAADGEPAVCAGDGPFTDVPVSHPFCAEITWMVDEEITTGFDDNTFRPTAPISRQAAAAFLWRLAGEPVDPVQPPEGTIRASLSTAGEQPITSVTDMTMSADGWTVAFVTNTNMVSGPATVAPQVYVRDLAAGVTTMVSVASDGSPGDGGSGDVALSADGRFVAFNSFASNLVDDDTNGVRDIFVHDRQSGVTERVSVSTDGVQSDDLSFNVDISADGRVVAFESYGTTLVDDDTNDEVDVFVHDRQTGVTDRVSVSSAGQEVDEPSTNPALSGDGRYVVFDAIADELVAEATEDDFVALHDRQTGATTLATPAEGGAAPDRASSGGSLSFDGRYLAFQSGATNLGAPGGWVGTDVYVYDRQTGDIELLTVAADGGSPDGFSANAQITADGRFVAFTSLATNLVPNDTNDEVDVFLRDRQAGTTERVSVADDGAEADDRVEGAPAVSDSGLAVAFRSRATNLVPDDTNGVIDVFVRFRASTP